MAYACIFVASRRAARAVWKDQMSVICGVLLRRCGDAQMGKEY